MNIAFIPARGGSKSIPLKNIKELAGKPLIQWVIDAVNNSKLIDKTVVSTDSEIIKNTVKNVEIFNRSPETATDTASSELPLLEFCEKQNKDDLIIFLQTTSPLITTDRIDEGIRKVVSGEYSSAISVVRQKRFIWNDDGTPTYNLIKRPRRQEWNGYLVENGAFYISRVKDILASKCRLSGMIATIECPEETYLEIDEISDWIIVGELLKLRD
jgi:CMP-N-acetylneuraminic acid synthetase